MHTLHSDLYVAEQEASQDKYLYLCNENIKIKFGKSIMKNIYVHGKK